MENTYDSSSIKRILTVAVVSAARGCTPFRPTTLQQNQGKNQIRVNDLTKCIAVHYLHSALQMNA